MFLDSDPRVVSSLAVMGIWRNVFKALRSSDWSALQIVLPILDQAYDVRHKNTFEAETLFTEATLCLPKVQHLSRQ